MNFTRRETLAGTLGFAATVCAPARAMAELPGSFADPRIRALGAGNGAHCCRNGPCADLFGPIRSVRAGERRADIRSRRTRRTATRPPCSLRFAEAPSRQTGHPGSYGTAFLLPGDHLSSTDMPDTSRHVGWFQAAGVDVEATTATGGS